MNYGFNKDNLNKTEITNLINSNSFNLTLPSKRKKRLTIYINRLNLFQMMI